MESLGLQVNQVLLVNQVLQAFLARLETKEIWERRDQKAVKVLKDRVENLEDQDNLESQA